ncbi:hypothetical protein [Amycolatopsis vastitatis]|uniref:HNH endonuclease n=1 Tax=Amycolatopsis vastitatis TaxID=1905142 RepID=UPI0034DFFB97
MAARNRAKFEAPHGLCTCAPVRVPHPRKEIVNRLARNRCELCEDNGTVAVHHVAKLTRLGQPGPDQPAWAAIMAAERRKTSWSVDRATRTEPITDEPPAPHTQPLFRPRSGTPAQTGCLTPVRPRRVCHQQFCAMCSYAHP